MEQIILLDHSNRSDTLQMFKSFTHCAENPKLFLPLTEESRQTPDKDSSRISNNGYLDNEFEAKNLKTAVQ